MQARGPVEAFQVLQNGAQGATGGWRPAFSDPSRNTFNRASKTPRPPMPGLPPSARVVTQYPEGVSTGVGGGNAAASRATGGQGARKPPVPAPAAVVIAPANTAITGNFSGERRASIAAQNAAQGASRESFWQANPAMAQAAMDAGRAAAAARGDVIGDDGMISRAGGGYLSGSFAPAQQTPMTTDQAILRAQGAGALDSLPRGATADDAILAGQAAGVFDAPAATAGELPGTSDPAQAAYWQRADIRAWADANDKLATRLRQQHGLPAWTKGGDMSAQGDVQGIGPVASGDEYGARLQSLQGTSGVGPVADPETYAQMLAGRPAAPVGTDPAQRVAPAQMPTTGDTATDPAQALKDSYVSSIKAVQLPEEDELSQPAYLQPNTAYTQPAWPQGWF